ncbi:hypothetical protein VKT23_002785 [Stygiomarasmius scandens]|uniref:Uncharacterized protein n=1 Tax=Marasmiellus scandens TaxID=2682957 RepID=A0ABR1JYB4_9AGAR
MSLKSTSTSSFSTVTSSDKSPTRLAVSLYDKCEELRKQKKFNALNPQDRAVHYASNIESQRTELEETILRGFEANILAVDEKDALSQKLTEICKDLQGTKEKANTSSETTLGSVKVTRLKACSYLFHGYEE